MFYRARGGPVLADLGLEFHRERPPVYSVTSEAATSMSFQTAAPKPARSDASQGNDSFGTLVDSNTPANAGNDPTAPTAQPPSAAPRPSDNAAASPDNT